ncbi:glycoside hydrolase family 43 protein [Niveomyces insectorum RCEF 264]|uniref:Glycoside hydrolase family 43 protein n=1 Tax=Niveomyces insectorum RCEF 264 TaxID=1081102 RepID=A0A162JDH4_9HYPO|nr:glycoside hydrolase family 43 protein [Niveomyces insectorum RCEF 264]
MAPTLRDAVHLAVSVVLWWWAAPVWSRPATSGTPVPGKHQSLDFCSPAMLAQLGGRSPQADPSLVGYLTVVFLGADPYVYFYLSDGNNPVAYKALNKGQPILRPTKGTGGVRDPAIVKGGGDEAGRKWYIVGTDLDIGKTNWGASQRTGSRGIFVWESTDLLTWTDERLAIVEDATAGMVWAPEAIWDPAKGQYMVYWSSKFYPASDTRHAGAPTNTRIRYAYTADFHTFSAPQTFVDKAPRDTIDLTILPWAAGSPSGNTTAPGADTETASTFLRFMKDETKKNVFMEYSTTGLFGTWTRPGGDAAFIASGVEGPAAFWDNAVAGKAHLLLDFYGGDGYRPYESTQPESNSAWTASSRAAFPKNLRHGSVLPVNATQYAALVAKWGG